MRRHSKRHLRYTVIDVGAGLKRRYKDWLSQFPGLVIYAIEPHPELAAGLTKLAEKLEQDDLTSGNRLRIHEFVAVAPNTPSPVTFHLSNDKSSSSTLPFVMKNIRKWRYPLGRRMFKTVKQIQVPAKTLHAFCEKENIRGVSFLNVDVQGDALHVLEGLETAQDWDRIDEINVKVHSIEWELYATQSVNYHVLDMCRRHYFSLEDKKARTRNQEDLLCLKSDLAVMKGRSKFGWSKRATISMA